ncbi:hypothetical protein FF124_10755 [Martelella lutilitoris]|uniref:NB-ARC domain-containing protein n=1 Tax=Martelella lutilitoris TaxID=2583532 RepID=A0A5C4JS55_9HYPH|nr:SIR2 family protein [Martelella lutilitoris]TNB48052.1 hypothetical protein FF124_10755 [Martelella lutilitoris]
MSSIPLSAYFDEEALFDRLTEGISGQNKEVLFVVGAPLTAPTAQISTGVLDVSGVTNLIRNYFSGTSSFSKLEESLRNSSNAYQQAFEFLSGRRGPHVAEQIIKLAVLNAHSSYEGDPQKNGFSVPPDSVLIELEKNTSAWHLTPGVKSLGELCSKAPEIFGKKIITSNFDPLIEVSIESASGKAWRTVLFTDGDPLRSEASGCHVIHIHGFWVGSDCLHTGTQLSQKRPSLKNSILTLMKDKIVVVLAYGGWRDIFTDSLRALVANASEFPEIIWTFYSDTPEIDEETLNFLQPGLDRGRVSLYRGIDCHRILPRLSAFWSEQKSTKDDDSPKDVEPEPSTPPELPILKLPQFGSDRPPSIDHWVGREDEIGTLHRSTAKVVSITGLGGEGKSVLAAHYLSDVEKGKTPYVHVDWRDCKEEGDRIRTQIISVIGRLSGGKTSFSDLSRSSESDLIDIFIELSREVSTVIVLDNVDHYVDFGESKYLGILDKLVFKFSNSSTKSRLIITCRPPIKYDLMGFDTIRLTGLSLGEVIQLFENRNGKNSIDHRAINRVFEFTKGHAFWNDLISAQIARRDKLTIDMILDDLERGRAEGPDILSSIWGELPDRERLILQVLSETVRPENSETIFEMVSSKLRYNKFDRAMRSLTNANLLVVKKERNEPDLYDLHPLVGQFVRTNFARSERLGFIEIVLNQYAVIISGIGKIVGVHLPQSLLERFSQKAELEIEAGKISDAFNTLFESSDALIGSGNIEEYIRVAKILFSNTNWEINSREIDVFDRVLTSYVECLSLHDRFDEAEGVLDTFRRYVPENTARFIGYCDIRCYLYWIKKDYDESIRWGERGVELKETSNVDTRHDCSHNLALARRDNGDASRAISFFCKQHSLEELIDPASETAKDDGPLLGNVGRCLQLMGRHEEALVCLRKSAIAVEGDNGKSRANNRGWAREWIGNSLAETGAIDLAYAFYRDGAEILKSTSPHRARKMLLAADALPTEEKMDKLHQFELENRVRAWLRTK